MRRYHYNSFAKIYKEGWLISSTLRKGIASTLAFQWQQSQGQKFMSSWNRKGNFNEKKKWFHKSVSVLDAY